MAKETINASDVIGNSYYVYKLSSTSYTPTLNSTITITVNVKNVYGENVSGKSITLYQNGISKGSQTTNSSGNATWTITCSSEGVQSFSVENENLEIFVDNKISKSSTNGLVRNDGTIDTTSYQSTNFYPVTITSRESTQIGLNVYACEYTIDCDNLNTDDGFFIQLTVPDTTLYDETLIIILSSSQLGYKLWGVIGGKGHNSSAYFNENDLTQSTPIILYASKKSYSIYNVSCNVLFYPVGLQSIGLTGSYNELSDKPTVPNPSTEIPLADTVNGSVGQIPQYAKRDHTHPKSSLYAESTHNHNIWELVQTPNVGPYAFEDWGDDDHLSVLGSLVYSVNDDEIYYKSPYDEKYIIATREDVSEKEDTSNKVTSWSSTTTNTHYPSEKLVKDYIDNQIGIAIQYIRQ